MPPETSPETNPDARPQPSRIGQLINGLSHWSLIPLATLLAVGTACKTQHAVPSSADTDETPLQIKPDQSIQRCTSLLPDEATSVDPSSLSVKAIGAIATLGDQTISEDQFHRFIDWFYDPDAHPAASIDAEPLARAAAWFYTVRRRLDDAGATARGSQLLNLLRITRSQFADQEHYRQYLADVGLTEHQLAVELCRTARFLDFVRDDASLDVTRRDVDKFLQTRDLDPADFPDDAPTRKRAAIYLTIKQIDQHYPAANSPEWKQLYRQLTLFPPQIDRQTTGTATPAHDDHIQLTQQLTGGSTDWTVDYPEQMLRDDALPRRKLRTWLVPADTTVELEATSRDLIRTMYIPELGIRFYAPPEPKFRTRHLLRVEADAASAGLDENTLQLHPAIRPIYTRGFAHLSVHRYATQSQSSPRDRLAHISLTPTTRPLEPGVTRSAFSLDLTTADAFDGVLTSMIGEPDGRELYKTQCASCHGPRGQGIQQMYPKLAGADALNGEWPADDIIRTVVLGSDAPRLQQREGDPHEPMPPIDDNTTPRQVTAIINFMTSSWDNDGPQVTRDEVVRVSCATDAGFPTYRAPGTDVDDIPEDLQRAETSGTCNPDIRNRLERQRKQARASYSPPEELYGNQCATCHGDSGRGDGPAGQALHPAPTNFTDPDDWSLGRSPEAAYLAITRGIPDTAMAAYHDLSPQKRWALAIYTTRMLPTQSRTDSNTQPLTRLCRRLTKRRTFYTNPCHSSP